VLDALVFLVDLVLSIVILSDPEERSKLVPRLAVGCLSVIILVFVLVVLLRFS
jgi:hypothetical protein